MLTSVIAHFILSGCDVESAMALIFTIYIGVRLVYFRTVCVCVYTYTHRERERESVLYMYTGMCNGEDLNILYTIYHMLHHTHTHHTHTHTQIFFSLFARARVCMCVRTHKNVHTHIYINESNTIQ